MESRSFSGKQILVLPITRKKHKNSYAHVFCHGEGVGRGNRPARDGYELRSHLRSCLYNCNYKNLNHANFVFNPLGELYQLLRLYGADTRRGHVTVFGDEEHFCVELSLLQ